MRRITKTNARRLFDKGESIGLCPHMLHPEAFDRAFLCWITQEVKYAGDRLVTHHDFDELVKLFKWHNCNDFETGYQAAYYIEE